MIPIPRIFYALPVILLGFGHWCGSDTYFLVGFTLLVAFVVLDLLEELS